MTLLLHTRATFVGFVSAQITLDSGHWTKAKTYARCVCSDYLVLIVSIYAAPRTLAVESPTPHIKFMSLATRRQPRFDELNFLQANNLLLSKTQSE